ncbi:MAG: DUF6671 family protein [Thermomicrobiales bacterium]
MTDSLESAFVGRIAVLATKHGKERVIASALRSGLGVEVTVPEGFDTDCFGTFTRDVPRQGSQREAARRKAEAALALAGGDLAIASEGSFGPHPEVPFVTINIELVLLLDRLSGLEIVGSYVASTVVSGQRWVASPDEARTFAESVGFPDHGVIVRRDPDDPDLLFKAIEDDEDLRDATERVIAATPARRAFIEVDLRAHRNPTRMAAIAAATDDLVANAMRRCPRCGTPGFSHLMSRPGLPCRWCRMPTNLVLALEFGCVRCGERRDMPRPDGRVVAEPGECPICNP